MTESRAALRLVRSERVEGLSFFQVENRWYEDAEGGEHLRSIVVHPGAVAVVPYDGERVWLIRQQRVAVGHRLLEIPAGKLDVDGEDPRDAARRECEEEIGLVPGRLTLLHRFHNSPGFTDEYTYIYLGEQLSPGERSPVGAEERQADIVALPLSELERMVADDEIDDGKTLVGVLSLLVDLAARG